MKIDLTPRYIAGRPVSPKPAPAPAAAAEEATAAVPAQPVRRPPPAWLGPQRTGPSPVMSERQAEMRRRRGQV